MTNGGDAAEQVVRLSLEGFEVAAKLSGAAAKNIAVLLVSVLKQEQKTKGKARLTNMIKSGKELKVFSIPNKDLKKFTEQAKRYGVLYCVLRDKNTNCDMELPSDNIIIYGHHMNDGSMFAGLMKFKDKSFWEKHKTVSFATLTDRQTYEVIAVFKTVVYTDSPDSFKYYQFVNADTAEDFTAYVEKCKKLSLYETGITAEYGDKLLTLSTCEYSRTNGRLVVVAKLINE